MDHDRENGGFGGRGRRDHRWLKLSERTGPVSIMRNTVAATSRRRGVVNVPSAGFPCHPFVTLGTGTLKRASQPERAAPSCSGAGATPSAEKLSVPWLFGFERRW